jgi:hypothetical protein
VDISLKRQFRIMVQERLHLYRYTLSAARIFRASTAANPLRLRCAAAREAEMATIRAVIPAKLLPSCGQPPTPTKAEETVQGTIQATLPTAEVGYPEDGAEVVIQIADDEIVSAFVPFGSVRTAGFSRAATAVRPEAVRETLR